MYPRLFFAQDMVDQVLRHTLGHDVTNNVGYIGSTHLLYTIPSFAVYAHFTYY